MSLLPAPGAQIDPEDTYYSPWGGLQVLEPGPITRLRLRRGRRRRRKAIAAAASEAKRWQAASDPDASAPPIAGRATPTSGRPLYRPTLRGSVFTAPTVQGCGLYPFIVGSGAPQIGVPLGPHLFDGETVSFSALDWLRLGLVSNPTTMVIGQPGIGKSAFAKRLTVGEVARGTKVLILGDVKPDYPGVVEALGGQVIRLGRGRDQLNPLDAGPLEAAAQKLAANGFHAEANELREDGQGRRLSLLVSLCNMGRQQQISNAEELMLSSAIDHFDGLEDVDATITDVIELLKSPPEAVCRGTRYHSPLEFAEAARDLIDTMEIMVRGSLHGIFDAPTTTPLDLDAPAMVMDMSSIAGVHDEKGVAAAMLAIWAYSFNVVDADIALAAAGLGPVRNYHAILDELWMALRGGPGLVDRADSMTRINRQRRMAVTMITHSLADLEALPTAADVAKAKGLIERSSTVVIGAVPPTELEELSARIAGGLNTAERALISSWAAAADWSGDARHPGFGRVLIKTGNRRGVPVDVALTPEEQALFETTTLAG